MRILMIVFSFGVGGTEKLLTEMCNGLVCRGNSVNLLIVNDIISTEMIGGLDKRVEVDYFL